MKGNLMTLQEAAAKVGVKTVTLRAAISRGKLKAQKHGPMWFVSPNALQEWQATRVIGRPPKS